MALLAGLNAFLQKQKRAAPSLHEFTPFEPRVRIIEISKLAEETSGEGVSVPLESPGSANLVFVDEGHKGAGSEARTWKNRQQAFGKDGFVLEYSATFAQAIGAAGRRAPQALRVEYGKSILMDYSHRHFYHDGYGKDFRVLNLSRAQETRAHDLLAGGLLAFYQQYHSFHKNNDAYRPSNLEKPLWVFLGFSVNAIYTRDGRSRSDVAQVVAFLRKFLEEPDRAIQTIRLFLSGCRTVRAACCEVAWTGSTARKPGKPRAPNCNRRH